MDQMIKNSRAEKRGGLVSVSSVKVKAEAQVDC